MEDNKPPEFAPAGCSWLQFREEGLSPVAPARRKTRRGAGLLRGLSIADHALKSVAIDERRAGRRRSRMDIMGRPRKAQLFRSASMASREKIRTAPSPAESHQIR